jgi:hypothetical protein
MGYTQTPSKQVNRKLVIDFNRVDEFHTSLPRVENESKLGRRPAQRDGRRTDVQAVEAIKPMLL